MIIIAVPNSGDEDTLRAMLNTYEARPGIGVSRFYMRPSRVFCSLPFSIHSVKTRLLTIKVQAGSNYVILVTGKISPGLTANESTDPGHLA